MMWRTIACVAALGLAAAGPGAVKSEVARGEYLPTNLGCTSCHGAKLAGHEHFHDPTIAVLYSSNLSRTVPRYTDPQLDRVIRSGTRPDGSKLWLMDAAPYAILRREDMRALIAYLRRVPATGIVHPRIAMGPRFLKALNTGKVNPPSATLARDLSHPAADLGARFAEGRYLARTRCGVCHAPDLTGTPDPQAGDPPDLRIVAGYTPTRFRTLLTTGKASGGREVGQMSEESRKRFAGMTDADARAIYAYLKARAR